MSRPIRVAMIAPPWIGIPPKGYGGVENVLAALIPALENLGVEVKLFTVGSSKIATEKYSLFKDEQHEYLHQPNYVALPIVIAHIQAALNEVKKDGRFDLIHDHNPYIGPAMMANADRELPPILHTNHGPPYMAGKKSDGTTDNISMWQQIAKSPRIHFVNISESSQRATPKPLRKRLMPIVHNGVDINLFPFEKNKGDYFLTLARAHPDKGQKYAIRAALKGGHKLKLSGLVGEMTSPRQIMLELANPASEYRGLASFRYFSDYIFPYLDGQQIDYIGDLGGQRKLVTLSKAKALLYPIQWEEPFGMAIIEAMACGTPVIAMSRGSMPELIRHGFNGFLATNQREFEQYMKRVGDIDPANCRQSVKDRFSAEYMAKKYLKRYQSIIGF